MSSNVFVKRFPRPISIGKAIMQLKTIPESSHENSGSSMASDDTIQVQRSVEVTTKMVSKPTENKNKILYKKNPFKGICKFTNKVYKFFSK
jgi:hypothetical protein